MSIDRAKALKTAQKHLAKGQLDRAISEFEKVVESDPSDARSQLKLGDLYVKKGDSRNASRTYRRVADQYAEQGFFLKAVAVLKQILKIDPADLSIHEQLGEMYRMLSLTSDAVATFEHVVNGHTRAGNPDRALNAMGHLADLDPDNVAARIRHAEALSKGNRVDEAVEAFKKGADTLKRQGRIDDFVKVSERLLYHSHDVPRARELAAIYLERSDPKHALAHLQLCFKADAKDVGTLELLAQAFQQLGQDAKAISVYRELQAVHAARGQRPEQAFVLQAILQLAPDDAEARRLLTDLGDVDEENISEVEMLDDDYDDLIVVDDEDEDEHEDDYDVEPPASERPTATVSRAPAAAARASMPAGEEPDRQAQIERLLSECDVFIRYGLRDKVLAQLDRVLDLDPMNVEARHRLKAFHAKEGNFDEAVTQLLMLADAVGASDPDRARAFLEEASELAPDNAVVSALLEQASGGSVAPFGAESDDDDLVILDEEVEEPPFEDEPFDEEALGEEEPGFGDGLAAAAPQDDEPELVLEAGDDDEPELVLEAGEPQEIVMEAEPDSVPPPAAVSRGARPVPRVPLASFAPAPSQAEQAPPSAASLPTPPAASLPAPPSAAPSLAGADMDDVPEEIAEVLEEVDFYLAQGLADEARDAITDAMEEHGEHAALRAKLAELDGEEAPAEPVDQSFALAQKLAQEAGPGGQATPLGMDEVLHQFKEGVKSQVARGDAETHYDLGIAYMEMGLHAEAIEEFKLCLEDPSRVCTAHTMIGLSYVSKGEMDGGIVHFKLALDSEMVSESEQMDLWFEIGNAYELLGDGPQALAWYQQVEARDPEFRDVTERIQRIGQPKTDDEEADEFDAMFDDMILKE